MIQYGDFEAALPIIASHEGAGTVAAGGSSVEHEWTGARVMCGLPFHPCGTCADCTGPNESWRQYCANGGGTCGAHVDGFFSEYAVCDARSTTRLPDEIGFLSAAPLACAGRTSWRGVEQAGIEPGQWLAVVGSGGGLGHLAVQFAKKKGLRVIAIDARDDGLDLSMGADVVLDARKGNDHVMREVQRATGGPGADATLNLSDAYTTAALACAVTKMHGTMVQIAQPAKAKVVIPFQEFVFRDVRVKGSVICSPKESEAMVRFIVENGIKVKTNVFEGLDKIEELLEMVRGGKMQGKAVIIVDDEQIEQDKQLGVKY